MRHHIPVARAALATAATLVVAGIVIAGVSSVQSADNTPPQPAGAAKPAENAKEAGTPQQGKSTTESGSSGAAKDSEPTKKEIAALFDRWNDALVTGDAERVADQYASDAVLLPTASPKIRTNRAQIVDYFEHFLEKKPEGRKVRSVITVLDADSAIDAGLYEFAVTDPRTGKPDTIEARYTYEYEKCRGKWLIVNHHSSVVPPEG